MNEILPNDYLLPELKTLQQEYVIVQAWKKTANYIRYHNWFSDTLELDRASIDLPEFIKDLSERLDAADQWCNAPVRLVPAPKSQPWHVTSDDQKWQPVPNRTAAATPIRPLAHVSLREQVVAVGLMMCLADRVETRQGDPRTSIKEAADRKRVISYGNRLFCDNTPQGLRHRWGSAKLYRAYFQDYQAFLARPEAVARAVTYPAGSQVIVVHTDLRQFYDRVTPYLLHEKIRSLEIPGDDPRFFHLSAALLNWTWHSKDKQSIKSYERQAGSLDFSNVALPQGLVAAGFFANVALLDFDQSLREAIGTEISPNALLEDVCRYVDDLRIVLTIGPTLSLKGAEELVVKWLGTLLDRDAPGLEISREKTKAASVTGDSRHLDIQSGRMARIQGAISGGFDVVGGEHILDAIHGMTKAQERYSEKRTFDQGWKYSPVTDVGDATVARFGAVRFRTTYRSIRPLLENRPDAAVDDIEGNEADEAINVGAEILLTEPVLRRTQSSLDDEARSFALGLIEDWVKDPSNVRLLRIGLDLWPAADVLEGILELLRPYTRPTRSKATARSVALYCLSEIFRAGATETGFVEDHETLSSAVDIDDYRGVLLNEALRLTESSRANLPWYLHQQVLLYLATVDPTKISGARFRGVPETKHYNDLLDFMGGAEHKTTGTEYAKLAILARRAFFKSNILESVKFAITRHALGQVAKRDPGFAVEIVGLRKDLSTALNRELSNDLCIGVEEANAGTVSLASLVLGPQSEAFRNEASIIQFACKFLRSLPYNPLSDIVAPRQVIIHVHNPMVGATAGFDLTITPGPARHERSMYSPPNWCPPHQRWRFQLGYLLRFILTARLDFTDVAQRRSNWKEGTESYRPCRSHWFQRLYGLYNGHSAFGDDWLPITDWTERLLMALLRWPGCGQSDINDIVESGIDTTLVYLENRLTEISKHSSNELLILPLRTPRPNRTTEPRPLRACVVQTVIPNIDHIRPNDLTLSDPDIRREHRNHLSAALAAVESMLILRETHRERQDRLDWLILPELSVHPRDVRTHLIKFARKHKTIILAGLTYENLVAADPLVNSAMWIIPVWTRDHGMQIVTRRQGKRHLAPAEEELNANGLVVHGFRPCQWLIEYDWSTSPAAQPLRLTASICYNSTDLALAAALRHCSDVFAIPALNKDVNTFDNMAQALHYHMYQYVVIANNGRYGGSNAHAPYHDTFTRQVFHLHGQPQASVAFFEIESNDIPAFLQRKTKQPPPQVVPPGLVGKFALKSPPAGVVGR